MYDNRESQDTSFTTLVERVIQQLVLNHTFKQNFIFQLLFTLNIILY